MGGGTFLKFLRGERQRFWAPRDLPFLLEVSGYFSQSPHFSLMHSLIHAFIPSLYYINVALIMC